MSHDGSLRDRRWVVLGSGVALGVAGLIHLGTGAAALAERDAEIDVLEQEAAELHAELAEHEEPGPTTEPPILDDCPWCGMG